MKTHVRPCKRKGKKAFTEYIKSLFDKYGAIEDLRWVQYTPWFNDGDTCEFGVEEACMKLVTGEVLGEWYYDSDDNEGEDNESEVKLSQTERKELEAVLEEFSDKINALGDTMEAVFGNHVKIYVTRDGVRIEGFEHD